MPVITRIITDASGSSRSVRPTDRSPDVIQVNACCAISRSSAGMPTRRATAATDTANDTMIDPHAIAPETPLATRRPKLAFRRKPTSGNSGMRSSITSSPFQARERIGVQRLAMAEEADHDGQTDGGFGRGDGHDEKHDDLSVGRAKRAAERDEGQVDGVEHDLDRQEDRDQIAPHEHAG